MPKADNGKKRTGRTKPTAVEPQPPAPEQPVGSMNLELPPGIVRAHAVFREHFPDLLARYPRQWVAVDGEGPQFVGGTQDELHRRCLELGLKDDEFLVRYLLPDALDDSEVEGFVIEFTDEP